MSEAKLEILPPPSEYCQVCAMRHEVNQPHDATSFYYRFVFVGEHGRYPTWNDALLHCSKKDKDFWLLHLEALGIDPSSTNVFGNIKSQQEVNERLAKLK